ncbi:gamma-glutamyltransferase [Arachidicoccus terrestris]|uniref:gamma-glutamyltransferase n=1 Tax=Arachidicoccus terrestris TaxID=2875539 RepID=UPI001CC4A9E1|nr:gamma-glutamyltransferase [Arachidicoccus terrestris]UAY56408.1 gamma-glutamyltransferase [Arachidicoccus terrestris]
MIRRFLFLIAMAFIVSTILDAQPAAVKNGHFQNGVVVCASAYAAEIGASILKQGGNAYDAAIATQLALAVVYPQAGNIGGGGFMVARNSQGALHALDFREMAPLLATTDMYLDADGNANLHKSQDGHLSVGVPGSVAGIFSMYKFARLPFKQLIDPAIRLAEKGCKLTESEARLLNRFKADFQKYNRGPVAFVKDSPWKAGDLLVQKELAGTLKRIRDKGAAGFYKGKTAALIVAEMQRGSGIISTEDLARYEAKVRKPIEFKYHGYQIISFPPPSSGGLLLAQMMGMIAPFNIDTMGFLSAKAIHIMTEAERRAYADRAKYMGDPDYFQVPDSLLMDGAYLRTRMADFDPQRATPSSTVGAGNLYESNETTHICVADREGNLVSITTTLNGNFGSRVVVKGAGFLLNDEMDDFSAKPGVPNMFGAVGGVANAIEPGKRMLSSMCPTLVLKENKPYMVVGTPGGTTIPTSVFQTIVDIIDYGKTPREATEAPKFHHQWLPDQILMEAGFARSVTDSLNHMGYSIKKTSGIGRTEIILFDQGNKNGMQAAADIRGDDSLAGY